MATILRVGGGGGGSPKVKKAAISNLAEGTIVRIKEKGVETDYYLAQHDYQPDLNGSGRTLFVRKDVHSTRAWHSSNVNAYASSDIDAWLNSEFKGLFDADVREAIGETIFPYTVGNGSTTIANLSRGVFMLSVTELGKTASYANVEGAALPIANILQIASLDGSAVVQWTRSPHTDYTSNACYLGADGDVGCRDCVFTYGSRPAFTLPNTSTVLQEPNLDGSYTLSLGDDDPTQEYFKLTIVNGTTQPENPVDNTIWVNSDIDVGLVYLTPNAPESPEVGDVWINTANKFNLSGANASTNILRVSDNPYLEINVLNISQWDGSAWVTKENSAIYANGGWTSMALWIFNYGTVNEKYAINGYAANGSSTALKENTAIFGYEEDYITLQAGNNYPGIAVIQWTPAINFDNYNQIKLVSRVTNNAVSLYCIIDDNLALNRTFNSLGNKLKLSLSSSSTSEPITTTISTSSITGEAVLGFSMGSSSYARIRFYTIVLTA